MSEGNGQNNKVNFFEKTIRTPAFGLVCLILTILINAIIASMKRDWEWAVIVAIVLGVLLLLLHFLFHLMRMERKELMENITKEDGLLDDYLKKRINDLIDHGNCLKGIQEDCKKRILQNFFITDGKIEILDINDVLKLERGVDDGGEVWIITDELGFDVLNKNIIDAVISNVKRNITYKYFSSKENGDAASLFKDALMSDSEITDISRVSFTKVANKFDALLLITKNVVILNPNNNKRMAFFCMYSTNNFEKAFYRRLEADEIEALCKIIKDKNLWSPYD